MIFCEVYDEMSGEKGMTAPEQGNISGKPLPVIPMAEEDDKQKQEKPQLLKASELDAIVKECLISPSQEEILRRIGQSNHQSPQLSHATTTSGSQFSSRDFLTVGAHQTIFYSPQEIQPHQSSDAEEEEEERFDPKFESDRDESHSLNTQCFDITKSFAIFNSDLQTPPKTKLQSALQLQEAASAYSKFCNSTLPKYEVMGKPSSCRRRLIGPSEEMEKSAKSPSDLAAAETLNDKPLSNSQVNCGQMLDSHDFKQLDIQAFQSLSQIETSELAVASAACKLPDTDEKGQGQSWVEEIRAGEISAPTCLDSKSKDEGAVVKPYLETLMDVIMHCSGEPPVGYQDADVLEAAINVGITFPPPLSRHSFCK